MLVVACLRGRQTVVASAPGHELLWVDLSRGAKSAARGTGGRSWSGIDHAPALEHLVGAPDAAPALRVTPCAVVPLGWPMGRYGPTTRRPVGQVVHLDRYGDQPFKTPEP